jgi:hypothetical protein
MYGESRSGVMTTECAAFHGAFNQSGKSVQDTTYSFPSQLTFFLTFLAFGLKPKQLSRLAPALIYTYFEITYRFTK